MVSIWEKESFLADCDVLIAGGGLMGLWLAYELKKHRPPCRVTVADALVQPAAASTRNAGFACFGSPSELWADRTAMGDDAMWQLVETRYRGIGKIREVMGDDAISFEPSGGFEVYRADAEWNGRELAAKLEWLNRGFREITGLPSLYRDCSAQMDAMGLKGFAAMAGNRIEGGLHSGLLVKGLQTLVRQMGVTYLTGYKCTGGHNGPDGWQLHKTDGTGAVRIRAKQLVWATNAAIGSLSANPFDITPARGQVLLSPPLMGATLKGTFHYLEGFYYFRNLGNRLLIGGARNEALQEEASFEMHTTSEIRQHLEQFIGMHLPQYAPLLAEPRQWMHWAGIMGMSPRKLPVATCINEGEWVAFACNGMGVALTPMVAASLAPDILAILQ